MVSSCAGKVGAFIKGIRGNLEGGVCEIMYSLTPRPCRNRPLILPPLDPPPHALNLLLVMFDPISVRLPQFPFTAPLFSIFFGLHSSIVPLFMEEILQ